MMEAREALLRQASEAAIEHLAGLADRAVAPTPAALAALAALPSAVPEHGRDAAEVLRELAEVGGPAMHGSGGGRYFGFVTGGSLPVAAAADWLTTAWDQNAWSAATSPEAASLERRAVAGLLATLGLPGEGALCSGATGANIIALTAAWDAVLAAAGWDVEVEGLVGAPPIAVYVGAEAHGSVNKALGVVGLGRSGRGKHVTTLATDPAGAVRAGAFAGLPPPAGPAIVVLQAGHVNTGAFDDFAAAVAWARAGGTGRVWVHVDGAFGLWAAASGDPARRALARGVDGADSWATDLHKMLNVPYESALVAVRDGRALHGSMASAAPYLPAGAGADAGADAARPLLPELQNSRRARGVAAWAALQQLGADGVARLVDDCCAHAARLASLLQRGGATLVHPVVFNQTLVRFCDDDVTAAVAAAAQRDGRCWVAATRYQGRTVIRLSVSCWATTNGDVEVAARAILECKDDYLRRNTTFDPQ